MLNVRDAFRGWSTYLSARKQQQGIEHVVDLTGGLVDRHDNHLVAVGTQVLHLSDQRQSCAGV